LVSSFGCPAAKDDGAAARYSVNEPGAAGSLVGQLRCHVLSVIRATDVILFTT